MGSQETEYVVLQREGDGQRWVQVGKPTRAHSAEQAIRGHHNGEGVYVAVPARSFQPMALDEEPQPPITRLRPVGQGENTA